MESQGTPFENRQGMKPSPLVELNPNMLVRDIERMHTARFTVHTLHIIPNPDVCQDEGTRGAGGRRLHHAQHPEAG